MLQSVIDLQKRAINDVVSWLHVKDEVTFKSPTGSGKTYMMFKIMERLLEKDKKAPCINFVPFLYLSLPKE